MGSATILVILRGFQNILRGFPYHPSWYPAGLPAMTGELGILLVYLSLWLNSFNFGIREEIASRFYTVTFYLIVA